MKQPATLPEFEALLNAAPADKLVVVDFTASGPCQQIAPFYAQLESSYPHVLFLKVDVDASQDISAKHGVTAMPTFQFFKGGTKIHEIKGADRVGLEGAVKDHQGPMDTAPVPAAVGKHVLLNDYIEAKQHGTNTVDGIWKSSDAYLESDCDEQLIFSVPFNEAVKLHSIEVSAPEDTGPKTIKTFVNLPNTLSFSDVEDTPAVETLILSPGKCLLELRFVRYQSVKSIQIFVVDNQTGTDTTTINELKFFGTPCVTTKAITESFVKPPQH